MALQTQVRLRSRGNPLFRRHGTLCRDRRRGGIKPRAGRMLGARNAPTFTGRDCHLQSTRNVVTLIRRAHAASAVFSSSLVTRTLHRVPSSTPRSLPFDRFVAAYNSYHCAPVSRFNPGAPGAHSVHGLVAHLEPPLENHLNHLPRHKYAEVLKGHPCTPSCTVYFRSSFVTS